MVSFKMFMEASALNVNYRLPSAWETRIYDFYAFSYLSSIIKDRDLDRAEKFHFKETQKTLLNSIRDWLQKEIILSCVGELRHGYDRIEDRDKTSNLPENFRNFFNIINKYPSHSTGRKDLRKNTKGLLDRYDMSPHDVIKLAVNLFSKQWEKRYGGDSWKEIALAYYDLESARSLSDLTVQIDHTFDLQHNGESSFLDKGYDEKKLKDALDNKRDIVSMEYLRPFLSRDMRIIVNSYTPSHISHPSKKIVREVQDMIDNPKKYFKNIDSIKYENLNYIIENEDIIYVKYIHPFNVFGFRWFKDWTSFKMYPLPKYRGSGISIRHIGLYKLQDPMKFFNALDDFIGEAIKPKPVVFQ